MPRRKAFPLPEPFDFLEWKIVAGQVEHAVEQHGSMSGRKNEAVAIGPGGIMRIVTEKTRPDHVSRGSQAHRRSGMSGVRLLYSVYRKDSNCVDAQLLETVIHELQLRSE